MKLKGITVREGWKHKNEPPYVVIVEIEDADNSDRKMSLPLLDAGAQRILLAIADELSDATTDARLTFAEDIRAFAGTVAAGSPLGSEATQ